MCNGYWNNIKSLEWDYCDWCGNRIRLSERVFYKGKDQCIHCKGDTFNYQFQMEEDELDWDVW